MKKDRFGISITFYAVLGFVFAILGQTLLGGLLLGFSIVAVQDEWLTRQTLQAFFLSLISGFVSVIIGAVSWSYRIPFLGTVLSGIFGIITALATLVILILAIIGLLNVIRDEDANVPFCRGLADKVFGPVNQF